MLKNKQPTAVSIRATMQQQHLASARNRRLAQQMENRPSVQAALNQKQVRSEIKLRGTEPCCEVEPKGTFTLSERTVPPWYLLSAVDSVLFFCLHSCCR